jgi:3-(3-hydroxy-phenyl)propionate hydroxylase
MRPAGRGELESLYFEYPGYSFRPPPEMDGNAIRHRTGIVGAGPVGLAVALELPITCWRLMAGRAAFARVWTCA